MLLDGIGNAVTRNDVPAGAGEARPSKGWLWARCGNGRGCGSLCSASAQARSGVLVGAGGGFIIAPLLRIFFDKNPEIVAGTTVTLVAINSISGAFAYRSMRVVDRRSAVIFALAAIPGSVVAPFALSSALEGVPGIYDFPFGLLLILLAVRIATQKDVALTSRRPLPSCARGPRFVKAASLKRRVVTTRAGRTYRYRLHEGYGAGVNLALGFVSSFFGIGGGWLRTPILVYLFGFPVQIAVATSIFTLSFYTTAGAATYAIRGAVELFPTLLFTGAGIIVGAQIGARLSNVVRGIWIMRILMLLIFAMGVYLSVNGVREYLA